MGTASSSDARLRLTDTASPRPLAARLVLLASLLATLAIHFAGHRADRPLEAHEVFVARTATEMARSGEYWVPSFNGAPRLEKPPLSYWAAIGVHRLSTADSDAPVTGGEARLPSLLAALGLLATTWALARGLAGENAAAIATALLAMSVGFISYAQNARPEMVHALFAALFLLGLVRLCERSARSEPTRFLATGTWLAFVLATLGKGPFVCLAFLFATSLVLIHARGRKGLRALHLPLAGVLVVGLAGSYFAFLAWRVPGAVSIWLTDVFEDSGADDAVWLQPFKLYYAWSTPILLLPWSLALPGALLHAWRQRDERGLGLRILLASVLSNAFFLSLTSGPHAYYMLPSLAPLSVLTGVWMAEVWRRSKRGERLPWLRPAWNFHAGLLVVACALLPFLVWRSAGPTRVSPAFVAAFVGLAAALVLVAWRWGSGQRRAWIALAASAVLIAIAANATAVLHSARRETIAEFSRRVRAQVPDTRPIAVRSGDWEVLVQYADRGVRRGPWSDIQRPRDGEATPLVLVRRRDQAQIAGRVLVEETWAGPEANLLVELDSTVERPER